MIISISPKPSIPKSIMPGPPRDEAGEFVLGAEVEGAVPMIGGDDPRLERWADIAGNYYSDDFVSSFSYEDTGPQAPRVWVRIAPRGETLTGRLEARNLKPYFAYQIKLMGDFQRDPEGAEIIGYRGRWRLLGGGTNFTDHDYERHGDPATTRAYILFDFFVTDENGHASRDFALDHSLHVLWLRSQTPGRAAHLIPVTVDASDPTVYAEPTAQPQTVQIFAEREHARYEHPDDTISLPPRQYRGKLVLTEESLHSLEASGGFWATVYQLPVTFTVTPQP